VGRIASKRPSCDILLVTIFGDEESVIGALESGARGYLLKGALEHDIAEDIRHLRNGAP
jgi:DNA-binding NarL/FixJ family response regulator